MDQPQYGKSGATCFINSPEYWCSHGCATDRLVDECEQEHPNGYQGRQTCWWTWMMSAMDAQQKDLLMHMDTVNWIMCQYGCSTDRLVDAHEHCCYSL